jgi:DNA repair protein RecN (Recombination protein N)
MLTHLHIRNFAIVPTLDLDIPDGFTAITGETGAGKSILVDALGLLLGDRSDAGWVRAGADRAELTAEFSVESNPEAQKWLLDSELSANDICLLRRTISANGRSRAFINGSPVTVAQIQSLGHLLVELHGQNEHLRLTRIPEQFKLLDKSGNYNQEMIEVRNAFFKWQSAADELDTLNKETAVSATDLEFLNFQLAELEQYDLSVDSISTLQIEHDRLAAGGSLLEALNQGIELLDPQSGTNAGVNADINRVLTRLQEFGALDNNISEACQMLAEAAVNCEEASTSLRTARDRVDLNPERFEQVAHTLGQIHDLARKHRVRMMELQDIRDKLANRIERAGSSGLRRGELELELQECLDHYRETANKLHQKRKKHASVLSRRVIELMSELGMAGGTFELAVTLKPESTPSVRGDDELQIMISANPGHPPGPLNKIASGGELSRISLAIKVASMGGGQTTTQIFDEVDAGVGGNTANAVGRLMKRLSANKPGSGQALCVTHLAQVAVCASFQLQVRKAAEKDSTIVDTLLLDEPGRIDEIARMLSGNISEQSRAHAIELLNMANSAA